MFPTLPRRRRRGLHLASISLTLALLCGTGPEAEARCGDFGGLGVFLVASTAGGTALFGGLLAPGIIALSDETKDYPYPRNALFSVGAGALMTAVYAIADLASDCAIASALDEAAFVVVPAATLSASVLTAVLLWAYADDVAPPPPISAAVVPREGGGELRLGLRF